MGMIGVGGDGSVRWRVHANNTREVATIIHGSKKPGKPRKATQTGIDEASFEQSFKVSVKGISAKAFLKSAVVRGRKSGFTFKVPIRPRTPKQIVIEWKSK